MKLLQPKDVSYLDSLLLDNGLLKVLSASTYSTIPTEDLMLYGHFKGYYCFPTIELAEWLMQHIDVDSTIEIGAGHGALARYMKIPAIDSKCMELPEVKIYYALMRQPITIYPEDIIKLDAIEAIKKYKPKTVIGCWITHKYKEEDHERGGNMYGIEEEDILKNVDQYIVVGNEKVHGKKKILELKHEEYKFPWLFSRASEPQKNIIYIWNRHSL